MRRNPGHQLIPIAPQRGPLEIVNRLLDGRLDLAFFVGDERRSLVGVDG